MSNVVTQMLEHRKVLDKIDFVCQNIAMCVRMDLGKERLD